MIVTKHGLHKSTSVGKIRHEFHSAGTILYAAGMATSVDAGTFGGSHNLDLANQQRNLFIVGGFGFYPDPTDTFSKTIWMCPFCRGRTRAQVPKAEYLISGLYMLTISLSSMADGKLHH